MATVAVSFTLDALQAVSLAQACVRQQGQDPTGMTNSQLLAALKSYTVQWWRNVVSADSLQQAQVAAAANAQAAANALTVT